MARNILKFKRKIGLFGASAVVGEMERQGPLKSYFDLSSPDSKFGMDTWEKAEAEMVRSCSEIAIKKAGCSYNDIDLVLAGDLTNQCTATVFGLKEKEIPYLGLYGACSTFALSLGLGGVCLDAGLGESALCLASSHFCSAERQYRFPLEYGCQRTPTAQNTVTGCGCVILKNQESDILLTEFFPGIVRDFKISDAANMGAAMAPACADTLLRYFEATALEVNDFDLILSGDLGTVGQEITWELCKKSGLDLEDRYTDCGLMIYDMEKQEVNAGGSGCGCSASVFSAYITDLMKKGIYKNILLIGTGALLSPSTVMQKESIPGVAHLVRIEKGELHYV